MSQSIPPSSISLSLRPISEQHKANSPRIQETLLHALNASHTNWPDLVQKHALALLRSGDCTTFPALMKRVLADIKDDTVAARGKSAVVNGTTGKIGGKSVPSVNGDKPGLGKEKEGRGEEGVSLAVPSEVLEEGVRVTRECLELVIDVGE